MLCILFTNNGCVDILALTHLLLKMNVSLATKMNVSLATKMNVSLATKIIWCTKSVVIMRG